MQSNGAVNPSVCLASSEATGTAPIAADRLTQESPERVHTMIKPSSPAATDLEYVRDSEAECTLEYAAVCVLYPISWTSSERRIRWREWDQ
jgi:hypothetical protein